MALRTHRNALNAIRLVLATLVLVSHAWPLAMNANDPLLAGVTLGTWAVGGFFGLSGFLIAGSRARLSLLPYLWRRCLRIFPALWVALIVTAFIIAPIAALKKGAWSFNGALHYVLGNLPIAYNGQGGLNGGPVTPYGPIWNGSLWTLAYEFSAYLVLGAIMCIPLVRRFPAPFFATCLVGLTVLGPSIDEHIQLALVRHAAMLGRYFLAGALLWAILEKITRPRLAGAAAVTTLVVIGVIGRHAELLAPLPLTMLFLCLGSTSVITLGSSNDISYGMYVYAFPIEQTVSTFGIRNPWLMILITLPITAVVALISWFIVEKPALRLKNWGAPRSNRSTPVDHTPLHKSRLSSGAHLPKL